MAVSIPYDVIKAIEEAVPDNERAEKVVKAIEQSLCAVQTKAKEQKVILKAEIKEELINELATKADIARLDEALKHTATKEELEALRSDMKEVRIILKVGIGIMLAGFTIFNPGFRSFVETVIGLLK